MAVRTGSKAVAGAIAAIDEDAWADIDYTADGQAQVAETTYKGRRLIVRRTRLTDSAQAGCGGTAITPSFRPRRRVAEVDAAFHRWHPRWSGHQ